MRTDPGGSMDAACGAIRQSVPEARLCRPLRQAGPLGYRPAGRTRRPSVDRRWRIDDYTSTIVASADQRGAMLIRSVPRVAGGAAPRLPVSFGSGARWPLRLPICFRLTKRPYSSLDQLIDTIGGPGEIRTHDLCLRMERRCDAPFRSRFPRPACPPRRTRRRRSVHRRPRVSLARYV